MMHFNKENLKLINELPGNETVCKQILELIGNNKTSIKLDKNIKNSYYVFLNDTIYLSDKEKVNKSYYRISLVAHECIHSVQNKLLQIINFILSNIELIVFAISLILIIFKYNNNTFLYSYFIINILAIIFRLILEIHATIKSIGICEKYMKNKIEDKKLKDIINAYRSKIILLFPLFITSLVFGKVLRLLIIYFLI